MNKARKIGIVGILCLSLISSLAAAAGVPSSAPLNPEFIQYMQERQNLRAASPTGIVVPERDAEGHGLGLVPPPFKLPSMPAEYRQALQARALPAKYDLRDYKKISPVKDQGKWGSCWSFATYASMESCLLPGKLWDFSENNLVNLHGLDWGFDDGGNYFLSCAYLTRWAGPVLENQDPYPRPGQSPTTFKPSKHVQQVIFLPDANGISGDKSLIKQALMDYGAVYTSMLIDNACFNSATAAYYYNGGGYVNHAVTIVGWDDNYSKTNFKTPPPGNGAFIVKNSWGPGWGSAGYFYASYYDTKFAMENAVFMNAETTSNYDRLYYYDHLGWVNGYGYGNPTCWGANIFTAAANENLRAVGFYVATARTQYEIGIYTGVTAGKPRSGVLRSTKSGTLATAGYHTIELNAAAALTAGQRFSVVIKLTTPGYNFPLPIEYALAGYSSKATASPGQSYHSGNGVNWTDMTSYDSTANVCIKAYTAKGSGPTPPPGRAKVANDFDGDGKSDYAVFYYPSAHWYIWSSRNLTWLANGAQFGGYGWLPVPGDYDGRGKADAMLYSLWYGNWAIYYQESRTAQSFNAGGNGLIPVAGDYDADGTADLALYNINNGAWYIYGSSAGWMANGHSFGGAGWLPFLADYAGEGRNQVVLYNEASGNWYFYSIRTGKTGYMDSWGGQGLIPVPGDFDGDGLADFALYNYNNGRWFIWSSASKSWLAYNWTFGGASYLPVIGDYNGGGRDDVVVYSQATGYWGRYLMESGDSSVFLWGGPGCVPIVPWWLYWYYGV